MASALNNSPMPRGPVAVSRASAWSISAALSGARAFERGRAFVDAEPAQQIALRNRAVDAPADDFRALRQRREIDMRGEIGFARRAQRVGEGMSGDSLQGLAEPVPGVTVVDDQSGAVSAHAPSDFERDGVGAPFVDRALGRLTQAPRQCRLEMRQRIAGDADGKFCRRARSRRRARASRRLA